MSTRQLKLAQPGSTQVSDNLCCATIWLVKAIAVQTAEAGQEEPPLAELACAVSHGLAASIEELGQWRVAALVSGCQLLTPRWGEIGASGLAATVVQAYHRHYFLDLGAGELDGVRTAARSALGPTMYAEGLAISR